MLHAVPTHERVDDERYKGILYATIANFTYIYFVDIKDLQPDEKKIETVDHQHTFEKVQESFENLFCTLVLEGRETSLRSPVVIKDLMKQFPNPWNSFYSRSLTIKDV